MHFPLDLSEKEMLDKIPEAHLLQLMEGVRVSKKEAEILGGASYLVNGCLAVGVVLTVFIAALTLSGHSIQSLFGSIRVTLGHSTNIVYFPQPTENIKKILEKEMSLEVKGLPFPEALKIIEKDAGINISIERETVPKVISFPVAFSSKGQTVRTTLNSLGKEVLKQNGVGNPNVYLSCTFRYLPVEIVICFPPSVAIDLKK